MLTGLPERPLRRLIRLAAGWSLSQAAAELGVGRAVVHQWETRSDPRRAAAARYIALLGRLTEYVIERSSPLRVQVEIGEIPPARITDAALAQARLHQRSRPTTDRPAAGPAA